MTSISREVQRLVRLPCAGSICIFRRVDGPKIRRAFLLAVAVSAVVYAGRCTNPISSTSTGAPLIKGQPASQTVSAGQSASFSVSATGAAPLSYQWQRNGTIIAGANGASYTIPAVASADNGAAFSVTVSNADGSAASGAAVLTVAAARLLVTTYHNDNARTGQNLAETSLSPLNVSSTKFGKTGFLSVQGLVDAEPLYVSGLNAGGTVRNVVFVATEHDLVYAFDADTFAPIWQVSVVGPGETPSDDRGCSQVTPEIGITSTPAIDPSAGPNGTIFLVAMSKDGNGNYYQRLHALDLATGVERGGGPTVIQAASFDPKQYKERAGLLLLNGVIYLAWASHCDITPYNGWVMGYDEASLTQVSAFDFTPNGTDGSVWMSGAGMAADAAGNIYFLAANGTFDTTLDANGFPSNGDYGNAFVKLSASGGSLSVSDYFTMYNTVAESNADQDLGSGGALVLPDQADGSGTTWHLAVGAGKDANLYLVNRDSMGKFNPSTDSAIYEELSGAVTGGVYSMPAYYHGSIYYCGVGGSLEAFAFSNARLGSSPTSTSAASFAYPGATPSVSANGSTNAIVWVVENRGGAGVLHAYDATNLGKELYNSNQAGTRDNFSDNKFITPMIANGRVYVGTQTGVVVFGLLP
jgi:hypothetical protein